MDFDKDNPTPQEPVTVGSVPPELSPVLQRVRELYTPGAGHTVLAPSDGRAHSGSSWHIGAAGGSCHRPTRGAGVVSNPVTNTIPSARLDRGTHPLP